MNEEGTTTEDEAVNDVFLTFAEIAAELRVEDLIEIEAHPQRFLMAVHDRLVIAKVLLMSDAEKAGLLKETLAKGGELSRILKAQGIEARIAELEQTR